MASFLNTCRFFPTAGGTTDWTVSSAVGGYQAPSAAGAVNGALYRYRAESADLTQWEDGYGTYNASTGVLSRSTVLFNSAGTTAKIGFSTVPQVAIVALAEDLGGWTNRRVPVSAAYTVAQADSGATLAMTAGVMTPVTFANPSGYDKNHVNRVLNEDTRAKLILPWLSTSSTSNTIGTGSALTFTVATGLSINVNKQRYRLYSLANQSNWVAGRITSYSGTSLVLTPDASSGSGTITDWQIAPEVRIWPGQSRIIFASNGAWYMDAPARWLKPNLTLNVDTTGNNSTGDGLGGTGTSALSTLQEAADIIWYEVDQQGVSSFIAGTHGQTFAQNLFLVGQPVGRNVITITSDDGVNQMTWTAPASGDNHCTLSDHAQCIFKNIRFAPGSTPRNVVGKACIYQHNDTVADIFDNCTFVGAGGNDTAVWLDNIGCIMTFNGVSLSMAGTWRNIVRHDCGGKTSWGGTTAASGAVSVTGTGGIIYSRYGAQAQVSTSWNTASGSFSATGSVADRQGLIEAFGTSIPGGVTADTTTGGIYVP